MGLVRSANVHVWAQILSWLADPSDATDVASFRATCKTGIAGFNVAVHAGWIALARHALDAPHNPEATCRWIDGWIPTSIHDASRISAGQERHASVSFRVERRLFRRRHVTTPDGTDARWFAADAVICETLDMPTGSFNEVAARAVVANLRTFRIAYRLAPSSHALDCYLPHRLALCHTLRHLDTTGMEHMTAIGDSVFARMTVLESVDTSGLRNVVDVGDEMFKSCGMLRSFDIGALENVVTIGDGCLQGCWKLQEVSRMNRMAKLEVIGADFLASTRVFHVDLESLPSLQRVGARCLDHCTFVQRAGFCSSAKITAVGPGLFANCLGLAEVKLSGLADLQFLPYEAFARCRKLRRVDVTGLGAVEHISTYVLYDCTSLVTINLAGGAFANVIAIDDSFLSKCTSLAFFDASSAFRNTKRIGSHFLSHCTSLTSVNLSGFVSLEHVGDKFLLGDHALVELNLSGLRSVKTIGKEFVAFCTSLKTVPLSDLVAVESIGSSCLSQCAGLCTVDTRGMTSLTTLGDSFLSAGGSVVAVNLVGFGSLKEIPDDFMNGCTSLRQLSLGGLKNIRTIGNGFLDNATSLTALDTSPLSAECTAVHLTTVRHWFLRRCTSLTALNLSGLCHVASIGEHFVCEATALQVLDVTPLLESTALTSLGKAPFVGCHPRLARHPELRRLLVIHKLLKPEDEIIVKASSDQQQQRKRKGTTAGCIVV